MYPCNVEWIRLASNQNIQLVGKFSLPVITRAVQELGKNKALVLNGFIKEFILKLWDQLKENFLNLFQEFYSNGKLNLEKRRRMQCWYFRSIIS